MNLYPKSNHMKKILTTLFILSCFGLLFGQSEDARTWGLGLRFGDPTGLTFKKYASRTAWEFNIGRTHLWYGNGWYNNHFDYWYDKKNYPHYAVFYTGFKAGIPMGLQAHYLFLNPITTSEGLLEWYYGAGVQARYRSVTYEYEYLSTASSTWQQGRDTYVDIDLGIDVVIGLEYTFKAAPLSVFLDFGTSMEIVDQPFYFWGIGGAGLRYNL